jgi:hypothetical protein
VKHVFRVLAVACVALGLLSAVVGAGLGGTAWLAASRAHRAAGMVVQMVRLQSSQDPGPRNRPSTGTPAYVPVVEYRVGGQKYHIRGRVAGSNEAYDIGGPVAVLYPPDRLADGWIDSFAEQWATPTAFGGGGLLVALVGLAMLWSRRRPGGGAPVPAAGG